MEQSGVRRSAPRGPSLKPYLAIALLLVVGGVVVFSLADRWLGGPSVDEDAGDAMPGGGRVVVDGKPASAQVPAAEAPPQREETNENFSFYESLPDSDAPPPQLEPPPSKKATVSDQRPPAPPPEPVRVTTKTSYTVQVGSFRDKKAAERLATRMRRYEYTVAVTRAVLPDSAVRYRVRVGKFAKRGDALKVSEILKKKERLDPFVAVIRSPAG